MTILIRLFILLLLTLCSIEKTMYATNLVSIQFKQLPAEIIKQLELDYAASEQPAISPAPSPSQASMNLVKSTLRTMLPAINGLQVFYAGVNAFSDHEGLVQFTLQHKDPVIKLAITEDFKLIKIRSNTVATQDLTNKPYPITLYTFERKENASIKTQDKTATRYWHVTKNDTPDKDSLDKTVFILLSDPNNFYIPTGDFITEETSEQIILPPLYVINNTAQNKTLLDALDKTRYHKQPDNYKEQKINNCIIRARQYALSKILQVSRWLF